MSTFALGYLSIDRIVTSAAGTWREQILNGPLTPISSFIPISSHLEIWKHKERKHSFWTSLVIQWLRIRLPMQRTWVWSLVQEDSLMLQSDMPMCHNYWSPHTLQPRLLCPWNFPGKNAGASYHFLLQGIFSTQGSNLSLLVSCIGRQFFITEPPGKPNEYQKTIE